MRSTLLVGGDLGPESSNPDVNHGETNVVFTMDDFMACDEDDFIEAHPELVCDNDASQSATPRDVATPRVPPSSTSATDGDASDPALALFDLAIGATSNAPSDLAAGRTTYLLTVSMFRAHMFRAHALCELTTQRSPRGVYTDC